VTHLFKENAAKNPEAAAIPVLDYGPDFAGAPGALQRLAEEVRAVSETVGCFYIRNHGVPETLVARESGTDRYSIAYFHGPSPDRIIECLPSYLAPGGAATSP
jgi:isopenicillin N synthase-like dioxygenase